MKLSEIEELLAKMEKSSGQLDNFRSRVPETQRRRPIDLDDDDYMPIGVPGLLAASEKLLAINKGLDHPDERDSLVFKRVMTTDKLLSERIDLDNNKLRQKTIPVLAKMRSLDKLHPFAFDNYMEGHLLGNPLSSPLEEINPLHLVEQARRITAMGPGGIGSDNAITEDMQAVRGDQFGYLSVLEGPESEKIGIDVRAAWNTRIGSDGKIYQMMYDRKAKKHRWMSPEDLDGAVVKLPD